MEIHPKVLSELNVIGTFHNIFVYETYCERQIRSICTNCDKFADDYMLTTLHTEHCIYISACKPCWPSIISQLKIYRKMQITKYIICLLNISEILNKDIAFIIIKLYYKEYGLLRIPVSYDFQYI